MQLAEDNLHYRYLKQVVAVPHVVLKLLLGKIWCFTMMDCAEWMKQGSTTCSVLTWYITEADWGCADIWWYLKVYSLTMKPVLWKKWWFIIIDCAGLKKQEPTFEGYNGWSEEHLLLWLKTWWQKYEECNIVICLCTLHLLLSDMKPMAWLASLWKQKHSLVTIFPETYW